MRRYTTQRSFSALAELNVTPLIDLAFTLLIIFMITTPLIENRLDLQVPTSQTASTPVEPGDTLIIEASRDGTLRVEGNALTTAQLEAFLRARLTQTPSLSAVIRPDRELPVQQFIDIMDVLKRAGVGKVGVMTRPPQP